MVMPVHQPRKPSQGDAPTQQTSQGHEVPVPSRGDVLRDLRKVPKAPQRPSDADAGGAEDQ